MPFTREAVEQLSSERSEPSWLRDARLAAWERFNATPLPDSSKDEDWRRTDISKLDLAAFSPSLNGANLPKLTVQAAAPGARAEVTAASATGASSHGSAHGAASSTSGRQPGVELVGTSGRRGSAGSRAAADGDSGGEPATSVEGAPPPGVPSSVIFCSLEEAVLRYPDLVREHLGDTGGKFLSLNAALWSGGVFVYVPPDVHVEAPLVGSYAEGPGVDALFPRTLVIVDRGASLVYIDCFGGDGDPALLGGRSSSNGASGTERLSSASSHIVVKEGGRLQYVGLQERGQRTWHFSTERAVVERDAHVDLVIAALGGSVSKSYVETVLAGPGTEANIVGLVLTDGEQHVDHQTLQEHLAPHTTSNLLLKSAVKGHSQSIFAGLVRMPKEAQQSDAFQEARALLLSEHAKADAIPKLEIVAHDVRCTHAGAIGQVDAEQKFYLQSRGIPEEEAERLIVTGFFEPALERIPVDSVRESTRKALAARLEVLHG